MRKLMLVAVTVVAVLGLTACKATQPKMSETPTTANSGEPQWVSKGVGAFPEMIGKSMCGVGVAEKKNFPGVYMQRKTAITRGREEVASQLRTMIQSVFKDYSEVAMTKSMNQGEMNNMTTNVMKAVVDETLDGAQVRDVWVSPSTQDLYALLVLDLDGVAQQMRTKIAEIEKDKLTKSADEAHKDLDKIINDYRKTIK